MKRSVDLYDFDRAFEIMGCGNKFSYAGKRALFEYLERCEDTTGKEIELDVVALCCDYAEYRSAYKAASEYGYPNPIKGILKDIRENHDIIRILRNEKLEIVSQERLAEINNEISDLLETYAGYCYDFQEELDCREERALDWLRGKTTVIKVDGGGVIIQAF